MVNKGSLKFDLSKINKKKIKDEIKKNKYEVGLAVFLLIYFLFVMLKFKEII